MIQHLNDFSDKLNPMLVKELRQGLRGTGFVVLFIALQVFLALILLTTAAGSDYQNTGHLLSRIIFFFFSIAVLIVQPLRGITAISSEFRGSTIDLLLLTRLNAWRIAFGKWVSIVSQSALLLTAIVPYLILRYFFGDMQIFSELLLLFNIFLFSAFLTAFTVGFSSMSSILLRVFIPMVGAFFMFIFISSSFAGNRYGFQKMVTLVSLGSIDDVLAYIGILIATLYGTWIFLDLAASMIAPLSENRATFKRIVSALLITLSLLVFVFAEIDSDIIVTISLLLAIPICFISLTENPYLTPPITAPFVRMGWLGKLAGRVLYPGWSTGVIYMGIIYVLIHIPFWIQSFSIISVRNTNTAYLAINTVFSTMLLSLLLTRLFARKSSNRTGFFLLFIILQFVSVAIIAACESMSSSLEFMEAFFWIPITTLELSGSDRFGTDRMLTYSYITIAVYFIIAIAMARPVWKQISETERLINPT